MWQYPTPKSQRGLLNVGLRRKHFVCRFLVFIFLLTLPISSYSLNSNHQENINLRDLVGIWKLCYSPPTNDGGPEVDGGYLVMLPDYTFNRLSNGNDFGKHAPAGVQIGTYKVINGYVYFHITQEKSRIDSSSQNYNPKDRNETKDFSLYYVSEGEIVVFDNIKSRLVLPVLKWQDTDNFDYCYAKIY